MEKSTHNYAEGIKPDIKTEHLLHDPMLLKASELENRLVIALGQGKRLEGGVTEGHEASLRGNEFVLYLDYGDGFTVCTWIKTYIIPHIKYTHLSQCGYSTSVTLFKTTTQQTRAFPGVLPSRACHRYTQHPNTPFLIEHHCCAQSVGPSASAVYTTAYTTWKLLFLWAPFQREALWLTWQMSRNLSPKYGTPCPHIL